MGDRRYQHLASCSKNAHCRIITAMKGVLSTMFFPGSPVCPAFTPLVPRAPAGKTSRVVSNKKIPLLFCALTALFFFSCASATGVAHASTIAEQSASPDRATGISNTKQKIGNGYSQTPTQITFKINKHDDNLAYYGAFLWCYNDALYSSSCSDQPGWTSGRFYTEPQTYLVSSRGDHFIPVVLSSPGALRPENTTR